MGFNAAAVVGGTIILQQGVIIAGTYLATQNPDAEWTVIGRYTDEINNYMTAANDVTPKATYFDLGDWYGPLNRIGLAEPMNRLFMSNQIAQAKDFAVYGLEEAGSQLQQIEIPMINDSGRYTELGNLGNDLFSNFFENNR